MDTWWVSGMARNRNLPYSGSRFRSATGWSSGRYRWVTQAWQNKPDVVTHLQLICFERQFGCRERLLDLRGRSRTDDSGGNVGLGEHPCYGHLGQGFVAAGE